jgi:hypothetical protein
MNLWHQLAGLILRNRLAVIGVIAGITLVMGYFAMKVQITYEFAKLLPDDDSTLVSYNRFKKQFGEDGAVMVIGVEDPNFSELRKFNDWCEMGKTIRRIKGIQEVVSIGRISSLRVNDSLQKFEFRPLFPEFVSSQRELDSLKKEVFRLPFYEGFIYSKDHRSHLMAITFTRQMLNSRSRLSMVDSIRMIARQFETRHATTLHYSGLPYIRTVLARKIASEMTMFLGLAVLVTAFILLLFFRSATPVIFSLLVVIIGVVWSFGCIVLFGYKITVLSGLIPPLIIVIGIPNCILMLNKYHHEYNLHGNQARSLTRMVGKIGVSTFFANVTTSIGFAVFCFTHSKILVEFGLVASLNVMLTYAVSLFLIPVIFSYLPPPSVKQIRHVDNRHINQLLHRIDWWVHHQRKLIYLITGVLVAVSVVGLTRIRAEGFVVDDLPEKDAIYTDLHFFEKNYKGVLPFEVSIDTKEKGGAFKLKNFYKINRLQKIFARHPEFSKPLSAVEAVKFANQAVNEGDPRFYILPSAGDIGHIASLVSGSGRKVSTFKAFVDSNKQVTRVSVQMADIGSRKMKALLQNIKPSVDSVFSPEEYKVSLTGNCIMFLKGNDYLVKNLAESVLFAVLLIAIVMFTLFTSFRMVVIGLLPSVIPLLITAGFIGFSGIPLKPSTILVFSIAFGIASDGNMYFLTKYRQEYRLMHFSISKTVSKTIGETGVSMIYTAIILFFGFGIFTASDFGGTASLGMLIALTLLISYASNLILLPSFLLSLEKRLITKAFMAEPLIEFWAEEDDIELDELKLKEPEK